MQNSKRDVLLRIAAWAVLCTLPWVMAALGLLLSAHTVCANTLKAKQAELVPVRLVLQWEHQAQFAGYYMAQEQGYYADAGLDLKIIPGGAHVNPLRMVRQGEAEFCTDMLASVLTTQTDSTRLVLLRQVLNRSNLTLVAWKNGRNGDLQIEKPSDLNGTLITVWETYRPAYERFLQRYGVNATILPQYYTQALFLRGGADACCAMRYNEYHALLQKGVRLGEISVFDFNALGIDVPEDGIYTRQSFWLEQPRQCEAFARASMQGWEYALKHPQQTLDVVMRYVHEAQLPVNRNHMDWMLDVMLQSIFPKGHADWELGILSEASYLNALRILGLESTAPTYTDFVTSGARHALD
ncbi:MAG: ABC transporter substrate-binding protein [Desulfuromonadaceae bacterium]|nr:ABC transporter substrate-binding protein [Desulfuromonas sp.]MDY0185320.1 ABC transporter substrate-binding protein [Desulfuromonadaceae bacterium]